ncbi:MAG: methylated-DNA--[protein]-cysteine S-methyltransferase [Candidatus Marinimicrobia bacterium]|nr:methylated-DNA--[protein]-cysteine S-methyltransferase [Candidatus Neomarinimicrobiota bacterium]MDP6836342.1 methylated-DNA--[protein]-cysteine S-methyltransferase [Candidatus Neomarinimicrobiota bacterium]MDP6967059.1 methylated-DNA--[protein]-cysteine S-methyltransferase [Candidatus Neomarinimicrobiota bacterium]
MIAYTHLKTPIGPLFLAKSDKGLCRVGLPGKSEESTLSWLAKQFPQETIAKNDGALKCETAQLREYFRGKRESFTFPLDLRTTTFRHKALQAVHDIPYGETASYKEIAQRMGAPTAVRAVGSANATNPIPIVIPCHRVLSHDGSLGGYGGGLKMKSWLLAHEGAL